MIEDIIVPLVIAALLSLILYGLFRTDVKYGYTGLSTIGGMLLFPFIFILGLSGIFSFIAPSVESFIISLLPTHFQPHIKILYWSVFIMAGIIMLIQEYLGNMTLKKLIISYNEDTKVDEIIQELQSMVADKQVYTPESIEKINRLEEMYLPFEKKKLDFKDKGTINFRMHVSNYKEGKLPGDIVKLKGWMQEIKAKK